MVTGSYHHSREGGTWGRGETARNEVSLIDLKKTATGLSFLTHYVSILLIPHRLIFGFKVLYY